jgi:transcriptional regulator with XRE-family HTH domain
MSLSTTEQLRAARALLGWTQRDLSERSGVSLPSIKRLETGAGVLAIRLDTLQKLQAAFDAAGVEFIPASDGAGVKLKQ